MLRAALRIAYDGGFDAYARQPGRRTVEGCLLDALRPEGYVERSFRSGSRTDRGVSALENVLAVRLDRPHLKGIVPAVQARLPSGLWITGAAPVPEGWNPRHARRRVYRYVAPRGGERLGGMRVAAKAFLGRHDIRAFARLEPGRDPFRAVARFTVAPAPGAWVFRVEGPSFLWNQVRRMVDAVRVVGCGRATPEDILAALRSGVPDGAFGLAPAAGLLLERVDHGIRWRETGPLPWGRIERTWQEASVRLALAEHLRRASVDRPAS